MQCWGDNYYGQLGNDGPLRYRTTPWPVSADYILTPSATSGGSIDPPTQVAVAAGASSEFFLTINTGYRASVSGTCGGNLAWGVVYTTNPINANCNVIATFTTDPTVPTAVTNTASSITASSATLNGNVTSNGAVATVSFDFGPTTNYGLNLSATPDSIAANAGSTNVTATVAILAACTNYHYRVQVVNSVGTGYGADQSFKTLGCLPPNAVTNAATNQSSSGATLNGSVTPNGNSTSVAFNLGTSTAYGMNIVATPATLAATAGATPVSAAVPLFACGTYHFRVTAQNSAGTTNGNDQTFSNCGAIPPTCSSAAASNITASSATLGDFRE